MGVPVGQCRAPSLSSLSPSFACSFFTTFLRVVGHVLLFSPSLWLSHSPSASARPSPGEQAHLGLDPGRGKGPAGGGLQYPARQDRGSSGAALAGRPQQGPAGEQTQPGPPGELGQVGHMRAHTCRDTHTHTARTHQQGGGTKLFNDKHMCFSVADEPGEML